MGPYQPPDRTGTIGPPEFPWSYKWSAGTVSCADPARDRSIESDTLVGGADAAMFGHSRRLAGQNWAAHGVIRASTRQSLDQESWTTRPNHRTLDARQLRVRGRRIERLRILGPGRLCWCPIHPTYRQPRRPFGICGSLAVSIHVPILGQSRFTLGSSRNTRLALKRVLSTALT